MALNLGRWIKYAQAKVNKTLDQSSDELDQLEAERAADLADKPWLASDTSAPTFEEAKARIEWETDEQRRRTERDAQPAAVADGRSEPGADDAAGPDAPAGSPTSRAPSVPEAEDPELAAARIELDQRARDAAERLDAIRRELGVDPPASGGS